MNSKIDVLTFKAWDEDDYQIDLAIPAQNDEYKRIIDRNAQLGISHMVFAPTNTDLALGDLFVNSDTLLDVGWEYVLWAGFGKAKVTPQAVSVNILCRVSGANTFILSTSILTMPASSFNGLGSHNIEHRIKAASNLECSNITCTSHYVLRPWYQKWHILERWRR